MLTEWMTWLLDCFNMEIKMYSSLTLFFETKTIVHFVSVVDVCSSLSLYKYIQGVNYIIKSI